MALVPKRTGKQVANGTTDSVEGEDIKRVINSNDELQFGGVVGGDSTDNTVDDGGPGSNITGAGSDGNETSNGTRAETDGAPLLLKTVVKKNPGNTTSSSGKVGDEAGHDSTDVHAQGGTTVEAEPADP